MMKRLGILAVIVFFSSVTFAQEDAQQSSESAVAVEEESGSSGPGFFERIGNWMSRKAKESELPYDIMVGLGVDFASYSDVENSSVGYHVFAKKAMGANWLFTAEPFVSVGATSLPISSYSPPSTTTNYTGIGEKNYFTASFGLFFHLNLIWKYFSVGGGLSYNSFQSGYIVDSTSSSMYFVNLEKDDFSYFAGANISVPAFERFYIGIYGGINKFMNENRQGLIFSMSLSYSVKSSGKEK